MGRLGRVYILIAAVLLAAGGLGVYSYINLQQMAGQERMVILGTMAELAEEKVIGIESEILRRENQVFETLDIENLKEFKPENVQSVVVLDDELEFVPGGFFSNRAGEELEEFQAFLKSRVIPTLELERAPLNEVEQLYLTNQGLAYLFGATRRWDAGRTYYVIVETDLNDLVGSVFPPFFELQSQHVYQVVDEGGIRYGPSFSGIPERDIVELPFSETVEGWRLRVAHKNRAALKPKQPPLYVWALIALALAVIATSSWLLLVSMRRERRANELKSEFISNVSHELKTPLSIISMFGELLSMGRTKSREQATEYAEIIRRESVRLSRLIDNVLDFAKIERGVDDLELVEGDIVDVVERAIELCGHRADRADVDLSLETDPDIPPLRIDANALTLATLNLIDNAIKYASDGERIAVRLGREPDRVVLEVRDFGPGIAEEEQGAIFDRFYRARGVRLKPIRGSGIGLALVKHIAEAHGGGVGVESAPGEGATFRLWIPAPDGG